MGHIVGSEELESLEKPETAAIPVSSAPATPSTPLQQSQQQQSPTSSQSAKSRRFHTCVGNSWRECVFAVSSLLPSPYADRWLRCLEQLLHNEGPLPECWRIYIAILALCRHEVTWVVRALTFEFVSADGDRKWLSGLKFAPRKLQALTTINNILAHRPWLLTSQNVLDLTKGEESWSISELCQALCIMTHFHSFASFLHSCLPHPPPPPSQTQSSSHSSSLPLTPRTSPSKVQMPSSPSDSLKSSSGPTAITGSKNTAEDITNGTAVATSVSPTKAINNSSSVQTLTTTSTKAAPDGATKNGSSTAGVVPISQLSHEDQSGNKAPWLPGGAKKEIQASPHPRKQSKNESHSSRSYLRKEETPSSLREFPHLCQELSFTYEDFIWSKSSTTIKNWEFNWQDHGYSLMTRVLNEMGNFIDERFGAVKSLSHVTWERNNDKSYNYRKAVWNFIQSLYGIDHDDYTYPHIDLYLNTETKLFIKKCCCWPESLEGNIPTDLLTSSDNQPSQLVPLSIIIMEARIESELVYALKAIIPHQR